MNAMLIFNENQVTGFAQEQNIFEKFEVFKERSELWSGWLQSVSHTHE